MKKMKNIKIVENKEEKENDKSLNENKLPEEDIHDEIMEPKTVKDFLNDKDQKRLNINTDQITKKETEYQKIYLKE